MSTFERAAVEEANRLKAFFWTGGISSIGFALTIAGIYVFDRLGLPDWCEVVGRLLMLLGVFCFIVFLIPAVGAGILWIRAVSLRTRRKD